MSNFRFIIMGLTFFIASVLSESAMDVSLTGCQDMSGAGDYTLQGAHNNHRTQESCVLDYGDRSNEFSDFSTSAKFMLPARCVFDLHCDVYYQYNVQDDLNYDVFILRSYTHSVGAKCWVSYQTIRGGVITSRGTTTNHGRVCSSRTSVPTNTWFAMKADVTSAGAAISVQWSADEDFVEEFTAPVDFVNAHTRIEQIRNNIFFDTKDFAIEAIAPMPTPSPTVTPTMEPTSSPTMEPTSSPTMEPTSSPTMEPTVAPTRFEVRFCDPKGAPGICNGMTHETWNFPVAADISSRAACSNACVADPTCTAYSFGLDNTIDANQCRLCTGEHRLSSHVRYEYVKCNGKLFFEDTATLAVELGDELFNVPTSSLLEALAEHITESPQRRLLKA